MPNSGYVRKSHVRSLITMLVIALFLTMAAGLELVKRQAEDYAAKKATISIAKVAEAKRQADFKILEAKRQSDARVIALNAYQTNFTTCGLRALINPQLKVQQQTLKRAKENVKDPSLTPSLKKRQELLVKQTESQIQNSIRVRDLFGTIPQGLDCSTLPKKPPA